jgi:hypothetical protein
LHPRESATATTYGPILSRENRTPVVPPSQTLIEFADQIASIGKGLVLDTLCAYRRNAVELVAQGCTVVGMTKTEDVSWPSNRSRLRVSRSGQLPVLACEKFPPSAPSKELNMAIRGFEGT